MAPFVRPALPQRRKGICLRRGSRVAGRSGLPALRRRRAHQQDAGQEHPHGPLQVLPVPQAVHCPHGHPVRGSKVPLHVWLQAMYLIAGSKKGISSTSLHRTLGVTVKTAWFLSHRIREAMREGDLAPFGRTAARLRSMKPTSAARRACRSRARTITRWPCLAWSIATAAAPPVPRGQGFGAQHSADRA